MSSKLSDLDLCQRPECNRKLEELLTSDDQRIRWIEDLKFKEKKLYDPKEVPNEFYPTIFGDTDEVREKSYGTYKESRMYDQTLDRQITFVKKKETLMMPTWLISLEENTIDGILDIRDELMSSRYGNLEITIENVYAHCSKIPGVGDISMDEVGYIISRLPSDDEGNPSFQCFLLAMGSPWLATESEVLFSKPRFVGPNYVDNPYLISSIIRADVAFKKKANKTGSDCYTDREKIFFSALLIFSMHDLIKEVKLQYNGGKIPDIPEPLIKIERNGKLTMKCEPENIGIKKKNEAVWDYINPKPLPKRSGQPYMNSSTFVTYRPTLTKPTPDSQNYSVKQMHMEIKPNIISEEGPDKRERRVYLVTIRENRKRLKKAIEYLGSQGCCVALLPDVDLVIHLSDIASSEFEKNCETEGKPKPKPRRNHIDFGAEDDILRNEAKKLYKPMRTPPCPTEIQNCDDGLISIDQVPKLRRQIENLKQEHFKSFCENTQNFRELVWSSLHAESMAPGIARNSLIRAFCTYLPDRCEFSPRNADIPLGSKRHGNCCC